MIDWKKDKQWSDRFLNEIKQILGLHLIAEPPIEEDAERNTDLIVLHMAPFRVGCRVRKFRYLERYGEQFTIRAGRPSGIKTEMTKIIEGWGRYFFYGFADEEEKRLSAWMLGDLNVFRRWYNVELYNHRRPGQARDNHDNSSCFLAFAIHDLPPEFIVARSAIHLRESVRAALEH